MPPHLELDQVQPSELFFFNQSNQEVLDFLFHFHLATIRRNYLSTVFRYLRHEG
jgi:hypothetical protein